MLPTVVPTAPPAPTPTSPKTYSGKFLFFTVFLVHFVFFGLFLYRLRTISTAALQNNDTEDGSATSSTTTDNIIDESCTYFKFQSKSNGEILQSALHTQNSQLQRLKARDRMKLVIIDTDAEHANVRRLVGSIHRHYRPASDAEGATEADDQIHIVVYGIGLDPQFVNELVLWKNVEYVDIWRDMVKSDRLLTQDNANHSYLREKERWRPYILRHALEHHRKILHLASHLTLTSKLDDVEAQLERHGSYFVAPDSNDATSNDSIVTMPYCSTSVQGYTSNSYAHLNVLGPMTHCAFRDCTHNDKKLIGLLPKDALDAVPEDKRESVLCHAMPTSQLMVQPEKDDGAHCNIHLREDLLFTAAQTRWGRTGKNEKPKTDNREWIAIGMPSTSKGSDAEKLPNSLPLFKVLLPSLLKTIRPSKQEQKYLYKIFLIYDKGDPWYDNVQNQKTLQQRFSEVTYGYPITLQTVQVVQTYGWTTYLWNVAFRSALDEGFDYFYQVNDDLQFITPGWTDTFVNALRNNPVYPNFGVTGPIDKGNEGIFTQSFVHRTHFEIFGYYYPPMFKNWFSDDWITIAYDKFKSRLRTKARVFNSNSQGTRYSACGANLDSARSFADLMTGQWLASMLKKS